MTVSCFYTRYRLDDCWFGSHLYAQTWHQAERMCELRNIGETVDGLGREPLTYFPRPSELCGKTERKLGRHLHSIMHTAIFVGWVALQSRRIQPTELLGDRGVIHELHHRQVFGPANLTDHDADHSRLKQQLIRLEAAAPEFWYPEG